jgi:hypothetical protein
MAPGRICPVWNHEQMSWRFILVDYQWGGGRTAVMKNRGFTDEGK